MRLGIGLMVVLGLGVGLASGAKNKKTTKRPITGMEINGTKVPREAWDGNKLDLNKVFRSESKQRAQK